MLNQDYNTVAASDIVSNTIKERQAPAVHTLRCRTLQRGGFALEDDMEEKRCTKCGVPKLLIDFPKDKRRTDGRGSWCKSCKTQVNIEWQRRNPSKISAAMARYRERHPERVSESYQRWVETHRKTRQAIDAKYRKRHLEKIKEYSRIYRENHPEECRARKLRWNERHPEKVRERGRKSTRARRARKAAIKESFSVEDEKFVYECWGYKCAVCTRTEEEITLVIDHWKPLRKGYALTRSNAVLMCISCNVKKGSKMPCEVYGEEFVKHIEAMLSKVIFQE